MFASRTEAGRLLAEKLTHFKDEAPIVYAMPRGGLPVAAEAAARLNAPLELIFVQKIGAPIQRELAIGAVVDGPEPTLILHDDIIKELAVSKKYIDKSESDALKEIERRRRLYLKDRRPASPAGRTVIVIDDGIATGASIEAALKAMRRQKPKRVILAVPVAPSETIGQLRQHADDVICLETPMPFWSVGSHYAHFPQLTDKDVKQILEVHERKTHRDEATDDSRTEALPESG